MSELPPGLAKIRAKVKPSAAPSPNPPTKPEAPRNRDASPVRQAEADPRANIADPERWTLDEEAQNGAVWSVRLGKFISNPQPITVGEAISFDMVRYFPFMRGFVKLKPQTAALEVLEIRDAKTSECLASLDLSRYNSRVDIAWQRLSKKKKNNTTHPDQDVGDIEEKGSDSEDEIEEEDARRAEDTLEQFEAKLRKKTARMSSEDKQWTLAFTICDDPRGNGRRAIKLSEVSVKFRKFSKKKAKKEQKVLDWEMRKLKQSTNIPSSVFYKQVQALGSQPRTRRSRFTEEQRQFYLDLHNPGGGDESDVVDEEGDNFEAEDEDNE